MEVIPHKLFGNLRAIVADGIPWFSGKDVATSLGYAWPPNAIKWHVSENQKRIYETLREYFDKVTVAGTMSEMRPHVVFVNVAGVYTLILGSQLQSAVALKDWVCEDVLPTIRKYGTYTMWKDVKNERQLHYELCDFARKAYPKVRISPGLGENQDSGQKRLESYHKGYQ